LKENMSSEETMSNVAVFFLTLSLTAGATLAQTLPTGIVKGGAITLSRTETKVSAGAVGTIESTMDIFGAAFESIDYSQFTPPQAPTTPTTPTPVPTGVQIQGPTMIDGCLVVSFTLPPASPVTPPTTPVTPPTTPVTPPTTPVIPPTTGISFLDAGPVININGPDGMKQFPAMKSFYSGILGGGVTLPFPGAPGVQPLYLDPGTYTFDNGSGGADVGPYTATLTIPSPSFAWTNADADTTITASAGVDIQWVGGDPAGQVTITGGASVIDSTSFQISAIGSYTCTVNNTGDFVVDSNVLALMPTATSVSQQVSGSLNVSTGSTGSFTAPGIDQGVILFTTSSSRTVTYQ
jgi:hypothetical protein